MIKKIIKYRFVSLASLASLAFVVGGFFWAYGVLRSAIGPHMEPLILHFNDLDGITVVGRFSDILLMGILGALMVIINFFIAMELEERDGVLGKIVATVTLVLAILLFLGFVAILNVN
jgi:hypothetical protein